MNESSAVNTLASSKFDFDRHSYEYVNSVIEEKFYSAIEKCYKDFSKITQPILSRDEVNELVSLYKTHLKQHYDLQMDMFDFHKKMDMARNKHLKDLGYYDRLVFYHYLTQERIRFNQILISWGMVTAGSGYAYGDNNTPNQTFFGNSTTTATFMRRTKYWRETMDESIYLRLKHKESIVACIDNNQKGFSLKYQRFGSSNNYIKVTGCVVKKFFYCHEPVDYAVNSTILTYANQNIPSAFKFPFYPAVNKNVPNLYVKETVSSVVAYAKTQPPGVHQLQVQVYPPMFAMIAVNEDRTMNMHMTSGQKDDDYPVNLDEATRLGYRWYNKTTLEGEVKASFETFKRLHESVCHKIDKSIETHHGISCCMRLDSPAYEEGVFVLHFCDVLSIKFSEVQGTAKPTVIICTPSFETVPDGIVDSLFDSVMEESECFTVEEKLFVIKNASLYYYICKH